MVEGKPVVACDPSPEYVGGYMDGERIRLLYRDQSGALRERYYRARLASYHRLYPDVAKHVTIRRELERSRFVRSVVDEPGEYGDWVRVEWKDYNSRDKGVQWLERSEIPSWEGDVSPIKRHFADGEDRTCASPRIAYLDIETDSRVPFSKKEQMRVLGWCVVDGATMEPSSGVLSGDTDDDEAALLEALWAELERFDVVSAWYGDGFDFPVIQARSKRHGLGINFRRWRWLDAMRVFEQMNAHVAETGDEKQSLALNSVCQSMLGEGKHDFDASRTWEYWEAGGEKREQLRLYNVQDTILLCKLERKTGYTALFGTICAAAGLFLESKSLGAHQQMDGFMLRLGRKRGYHWPTKPRDTFVKTEKYKGAWVMQAPEKAGILGGVHVMDFSGMYPSIMISWNMSPETIRDVADDRPVARSPLTHVSFYTDREGILTSALKILREMRKSWAEKKASLPPGTDEWLAADRWAMAYKIAANSMYGVIGMAFGRYHQPRMAESVTQNGVWLIQNTIREGRKRGIDVIYGDTDSGMARGVSAEEFKAFVEWCNSELYPRLLREQGCPENCISLAYEKEFQRIVFLGAKKYCGRYEHYKGKKATAESKPEVRGMEYKRGDSTLLARQLQGECINLLMRDCCDDPHRYEPIVERYMRKVLDHALKLEEVVLSKSLSKDLKEYQVPPVHVRVAQVMKERGQDVSVGQKIPYVVVEHDPRDGGGIRAIPASDWTGEVDRYGFWENLVWPPTQRLLESAFPKHAWNYSKVKPRAKPRRKAAAGQQQMDLLGGGAGGSKRLVVRVIGENGFADDLVEAAAKVVEGAPDGDVGVEIVRGVAPVQLGKRVEVTDGLLWRLRSLLGVGAVDWD